MAAFGQVVARSAPRPTPSSADHQRHPRPEPADGEASLRCPGAGAGELRRRHHPDGRRPLRQRARVPGRAGGRGAGARRQARARVLRPRDGRDGAALRRGQAACAAALPVRHRHPVRHAGDAAALWCRRGCSPARRPGPSSASGARSCRWRRWRSSWAVTSASGSRTTSTTGRASSPPATHSWWSASCGWRASSGGRSRRRPGARAPLARRASAGPPPRQPRATARTSSRMARPWELSRRRRAAARPAAGSRAYRWRPRSSAARRSRATGAASPGPRTAPAALASRGRAPARGPRAGRGRGPRRPKGAVGEARQLGGEHAAQRRGVLDQPLLAHRFDGRDGGGAAEGCPQAVSPIANGCSSSQVASFPPTTSLPSAEPDVMPLATVMMSGVTPQCSHANQRPVRPNPVITSSRIRRMPCRSHTSRTSEVAVRRHEHAVRAGDRLHDDGGHRLRPLVRQDLLEVRASAAMGIVGVAGGRVECERRACRRRGRRSSGTGTGRTCARRRAPPAPPASAAGPRSPPRRPPSPHDTCGTWRRSSGARSPSARA